MIAHSNIAVSVSSLREVMHIVEDRDILVFRFKLTKKSIMIEHSRLTISVWQPDLPDESGNSERCLL